MRRELLMTMKIQSGEIILQNLRFHAFHGVMPQERLTGNDYRIDLKINYPLDDAVVTDEVEDTLNYATVYQLTKQEMERPSKLVENVAYRIAKSLIDHFPTIKEVYIKVAKCNPPMGADTAGAGVELHIINEKTE